ncbi:MAG: hypothetical protein SWH61_05060 [Thermodesulfobacteriota bacterium]|nr:hypothetical protein [Thermodesulfobacteriota bacterium]
MLVMGDGVAGLALDGFEGHCDSITHGLKILMHVTGSKIIIPVLELFRIAFALF